MQLARLDQLLHRGDARGAAHQHHLVNLLDGQLGVGQNLWEIEACKRYSTTKKAASITSFNSVLSVVSLSQWTA